LSASKRDRTTAPRTGTRASRAKHVDDRNVRPPAGYRPAGKPKPGEAAMEAQLAAEPAPAPTSDPVALQVADLDDQPPPKDPWWTDEREAAFTMVLQGVPQHQVAAELQRDRHTVARWMEDERFEKRLYDENVSRFKASRQRRSMQTLRLTDKAENLASKMLDKAIKLAADGKDDLGTRLAARDWLQEFRENSRREDEIYGLDRQRLDVNVHGEVQHRHKGKVDVSFKTFLTTSLQGMGIDPEKEVIDVGRADEALAAITERALMEGTFLDELVKSDKAQQLAPVLAGDRG
jgi:hypothetical protein